MGRKKDLSSAEKREIVECLGQGLKTLDCSQKLRRDHRAIKTFVADSEPTQVHADKDRIREVFARKK